MSARVVRVLSHQRPEETGAALARLIYVAGRSGVMLRFDQDEADKHGVTPGDGVLVGPVDVDDTDVCVVLGGDGTILRALSRYANTGVPVFGVNFGRIGFLASVDPEHLDEGLRRAFSGDFEMLRLPAVVLDGPGPELIAFNDIAVHRRIGERVAELAYALDGEILGRVRCDGLVVATPAGSTGYNLANGGPVMAWGVEGFVVSFIAPHSLTAKALVAAPGDVLTIYNSSREPLDISVDGRAGGDIAPDGALNVRFVDGVGTIAQLPGSSFYKRLREKFGRMSS